MIYADHAATTKISNAAKEEMMRVMEESWGNPSSLHTPGQLAKEVLEEARRKIAACLNAAPSEIYFTSGGSEADNQALRSAAYWGAKKGKRHLVSTAIEHHAILHTLDQLKEEGFEVTLVGVNQNGVVSVEDICRAIRPDTALVSVMYANNEIGTIQPIAEIGRCCREHGVLFHTDAVQAAAHLSIDVERDAVDLLSLSGHKFYGPRGVGVLYARRGVPLRPLIAGGAQERSKRAGTENLPAIAGMAVALEDAVAKMPEETKRLAALRDKLEAGLSKLPHTRINGGKAPRLSGTLNVCFEGIEGESLLLLLDDRGIAASSGSACTSGSLDPSHVLLALGLPHEVAHGSLRLSLGAETTEEDVDIMLKEIPGVVSYLRSISPVWEELESGARPHLI
jgi:cysteine desulfurase